MTRNDILTKAADIVGGSRVTDYGEPEDNFGIIAQLWSAYLGIDISSVDVSMLMVLFKSARVKTGTGTEDSFIDIAGYAACGGEIAANAASESGDNAVCSAAEKKNSQGDIGPEFVRDIRLTDDFDGGHIMAVIRTLIDNNGYISIYAIYNIYGVYGEGDYSDYSFIVTDLNGIDIREHNGSCYLHLPAVKYASYKEQCAISHNHQPKATKSHKCFGIPIKKCLASDMVHSIDTDGITFTNEIYARRVYYMIDDTLLLNHSVTESELNQFIGIKDMPATDKYGWDSLAGFMLVGERLRIPLMKKL